MYVLYIIYSVIVAVMLAGWLWPFWVKEVWSGSGKYEGYTLRRSWARKDLILIHQIDSNTWDRIIDRNKDGVADFKKTYICFGHSSFSFKREIPLQDKENYIYALEQYNKLKI